MHDVAHPRYVSTSRTTHRKGPTDMTHAQQVIATLAAADRPLSDYGIYHSAKSLGLKMTPSSVRTRRSELVRRGYVVRAPGFELSSTGYKAGLWTLA